MALTKSDAIQTLWRKGNIEWKLHSSQQDCLNKIKKIQLESESKKFVLNSSRRWGKSTLFALFAIQYALKNKGAQIKYATPTQIMSRRIVMPIMQKLLEDCPDDIKPTFDKKEGLYLFKNGTEMQIAGCDQGNAERHRGTAANLVILDEAGFIDELAYVLNDIFMPQTLTIENSFILIGSTPPKSPSHPFVKYVQEAQHGGFYDHRTIHDNPLVDQKKAMQYMRESGGIDSSTWRREYLAEIVTDEDYAIIPEFNEKKVQEIVRESQRPPHFDYYVAMDMAMVDLTVVLFGYWDFQRATLVVEHEIIMNKNFTTKSLSQEVERIEASYYGGKKPYIRVMDGDLIVLSDLANLHGLPFVKTRKDNKEAAINELRMFIQQNQLEINPRCKTTISHLRYGIWNKQKTGFDRSDTFGHFDAVDALVYMIRNINRFSNPYPKTYDINSMYNTMQVVSKKETSVFEKMFNIKK